MSAERVGRFDVGGEFVLPTFDVCVPGGRTVQDAARFDSTYCDTAELDLLRQEITLRRRPDEGWCLSVPADEGPAEIRVPQGSGDAVPDELATLLSGVALGRRVRPVAHLTTDRRTTRVLSPDGHLLAEVIDDRVLADAREWREVSVELGDGAGSGLLTLIGECLIRGGAKPARWESTLRRALGVRDSGDEDANPSATALARYVAVQVQAIASGDVGFRRGVDAVHSTRVGARRLRSTLRVFAPLLDPGESEWLDGELSWYAGLLGEVRDRQVQRRRFASALADLPVELVLGPVAARIESELLGEQLRHEAVARAARDGDRYRALLAALARWGADPPLVWETARDPDVIARRARRAGRRADRRVAAATAGGDDADLHRARKATKRARYAYELAAPVLGGSRRKIARFKLLQQALGEHQDSVVAAQTLRALGARAGLAAGENGFTFGLLCGLELQRARRARAAAARLAA